jgi:hypothetical protein
MPGSFDRSRVGLRVWTAVEKPYLRAELLRQSTGSRIRSAPAPGATFDHHVVHIVDHSSTRSPSTTMAGQLWKSAG